MNGRKLSVHTGPFDLASFHKAFDDWFQARGLLALFDDKGLLKSRATYGVLKGYDRKDPAIRYALML